MTYELYVHLGNRCSWYMAKFWEPGTLELELSLFAQTKYIEHTKIARGIHAEKKDMNKKGHIKEWICMNMALNSIILIIIAKHCI